MFESGFHFAQPLWLLGLGLVPLVYLWLKHSQTRYRAGQESRYADAHLLPYLTDELKHKPRPNRHAWQAWVLTWTLLVIAMAGPRWDYEHITAFQPAVSLVVLLDISASMTIQDVRPSRLARARQEVQDLLRLNPGLRIGLIAFATIAHVVSPLTEDMHSLQRTLPALSTELVRLPGSRLGNALDKAQLLLAGVPQDHARHILLITDGDFDEPGLLDKIDKLVREGIHIHILAVGTESGGPVPYLRAPGGGIILSKIDKARLESLAEYGKGVFRLANYKEEDTRAILDAIMTEAEQQQANGLPTRIWKERFYVPLLLALPFILYLFGRQKTHARGVG